MASVPRKVGFVYDERFLLHKHPLGQEHPEVPKRISKPFETLKNRGVLEKLYIVQSRRATVDDITRFHSPEYVENMEKAPIGVFNYFADYDKVPDDVAKDSSEHSKKDLTTRHPIFKNDLYFTYRNEHTFEAAMLSAGSALQLTDVVLQGQVDTGFALLRPPGHHAERCATAGFCIFNNVALAAKHAQAKGLKRIMIVDWDIHHGNGTQDCFYDDPSVVYLSLHKLQTFPLLEKSKSHWIGERDGKGYNVNIAWEGNPMGDGDYKHAFEEIVVPIAKKFAPELLLVSCGFDACHNDFLEDFELSYNMYAWMTSQVLGMAPKVALFFEGGYNIDNICEGTHYVINTLLGDMVPKDIEMEASQSGKMCVAQTKKELGSTWF